jgi:uncharacterized protein YbaR (Trm112 family)
VPFDFNALKDILRCPKSKSELVLDGNSLVSVDPACRLRYEIRDGIPCMFPEDAVALSVDEWSALMGAHGRDRVTGKPASK